MSSKRFALGRAVCVLATVFSASVAAQDWPHWRGPGATGVTGDAAVPVRWSAKENVAWSVALGGQGVSSPIAIGDRVIVTSQVGSGVRRPGSHPRLMQSGDPAAAGERALETGAGDAGK